MHTSTKHILFAPAGLDEHCSTSTDHNQLSPEMIIEMSKIHWFFVFFRCWFHCYLHHIILVADYHVLRLVEQLAEDATVTALSFLWGWRWQAKTSRSWIQARWEATWHFWFGSRDFTSLTQKRLVKKQKIWEMSWSSMALCRSLRIHDCDAR